MKQFKFLMLTLIVCLTSFAYGQELSYAALQSDEAPRGRFESYVSSDGSVYRVGDKVEIGSPSGVNGKFVTIQKWDIAGNLHIVGPEAINTSTEIKSIRVGGTRRSGFKATFQTKGLTGIDNYFFNIEDAIKVGEIKSFGMTSDQALAELKKAKDKLDLEIISQEEYNKIKAELMKWIK